MILPLISDGDFAMSELGDLADVILGMICLLLSLLWLVTLVIVGGCAVLIRQTHVHEAGVFAGSSAVLGYAAGPAHAVAGGCAVHILQGFVVDGWIGVGPKGPDSADDLVHVGRR